MALEKELHKYFSVSFLLLLKFILIHDKIVGKKTKWQISNRALQENNANEILYSVRTFCGLCCLVMPVLRLDFSDDFEKY